MIGLVNTVYVRSCLSLVNSFNSLSLVKHRRISSLSHPKHTLLSVRIRKMNTSLSKRKTVRKYGQIQTSGEYLFTDTEVNYQRHKKILSIKTQLERLNTCLVVHFVLQTSQYHRISRAWVSNQSAWQWIFTGLVYTKARYTCGEDQIMLQFVLLMVSTQILSQLFSFFPGYFCGIFPYPSSSNGCCFLGHNNCAGQPLDLFDGFRVRLVYFGKVDVTVVDWSG